MNVCEAVSAAKVAALGEAKISEPKRSEDGTRNDNLELELWATNLLDDDAPTALVRYVQANDIALNPFNRAIAATVPDQRRFGVTARYNL